MVMFENVHVFPGTLGVVKVTLEPSAETTSCTVLPPECVPLYVAPGM